MSADDETMGELINLKDWKVQKELEEIQQLRAQIREIQEQDGLPDQSPYYPKSYFNPKVVSVRSDEEVLEEFDPPGYFQFDPLQSAIDAYTVQISKSDSLPAVGPDAGFGPRIAYRAGEGVKDIIEHIIDRELSEIYSFLKRDVAHDEQD